MSSEAKVGIFVFVGVVMLFLMSTQVNKFSSNSKDSYEVFASLGSAQGLERYAKVKLNGVEIGFVDNIALDSNAKPKIALKIYSNFDIPKDSSIALVSENFLGGKYIEIYPSRDGVALKSGDVLDKELTFASFDKTSDTINSAALEFRSFVKEARDVLDSDTREYIKESFKNLNAITENLNTIITENRDGIKSSIDEIKEMALALKGAGDRFATSADTINERLPKIVENIDFILEENRAPINSAIVSADELFVEGRDVIRENREPLKKSIDSVGTFFEKGSDIVDRFDGYLESIAQSEIELSLRSEFLPSADNTKAYFSLNYRPNPTRYYMLDLVSSKDFTIYDDGDNLKEPTRRDKQKSLVSVQMGKRYGDVLLRGGIIESSGGVGIDYFGLSEDLKLSFEAFDFESRNDHRGDNPHLKTYIRYTLFKHIDTYFGFDNFLNSKSSSVFGGVGVRFVDDDMKTLIGTIGSSASFIK